MLYLLVHNLTAMPRKYYMTSSIMTKQSVYNHSYYFTGSFPKSRLVLSKIFS